MMDRGSFEQLFFYFMLQPEWWRPVDRVWRRGGVLWGSSQPRRNFAVQRSSQQLLNPRAFETPSLTVSGTLKSMADNQRRSSDRIRSRPIRRVSSKTLTTPKNSDASEHQEPPLKRSRIPGKTGTHLESRSQPSKIAESGLDPSQVFTPYQYEPLNEVAQEIRLLTILPGSFSSEIRICLDIKSSATEDSEWETDSVLEFGEDSDPDYEADLDLTFEALSYAWGSPLEAVNILIGESGSRTVSYSKPCKSLALSSISRQVSNDMDRCYLCSSRGFRREEQSSEANGGYLFEGFTSCCVARAGTRRLAVSDGILQRGLSEYRCCLGQANYSAGSWLRRKTLGR
jgi:hypothetical protein